MAQVRVVDNQAVVQKQVAFADAVCARVDAVRAEVRRDLAASGKGIADRYQAERTAAQMRRDWAAFKRADDRLTCLRNLTN